MKNVIIKILVALFATLNLVAVAQAADGKPSSWWEDTPWGKPDRGFNWYPDNQTKKADKQAENEQKKKKTIYEMSELEDIRKELEIIKGRAVVNPTEENVLEFLRAQNFVMDKSSTFADVSRRVVWANPDVNYNARSPVASFARSNERERKEKQKREMLAALSKTHGILYFGKSDCNYCRDQAPVLKAFSMDTGMEILPITLDGKPLFMFPDSKPDNGLSIIASRGEGIEIVPSVNLVERSSNRIIPLGSGVVAASDISERIRVLTSTIPGQEF